MLMNWMCLLIKNEISSAEYLLLQDIEQHPFKNLFVFYVHWYFASVYVCVRASESLEEQL